MYSNPGALLITTDDTGSGIEEGNIDRIFENGFSTKGAGRGTGLYQVKNLVKNAGGKITVESQEGIGASFTVSFKK
jgi:sensor histidine kinase regulating citrate/malate metabolism